MEGGVGLRIDGDRPGLTTNGSSYSLDVAICPFAFTGAAVGEDLIEILAETLADGAVETSRLEGGGDVSEEAVANPELIDEDEG